MRTILAPIAYFWAFPNTFLGLVAALFTAISGGTLRWVDGVLEVQGGFASWLLRGPLFGFGPALALTLGHVVLGEDANALDISRTHERVHVRQYEWWGPFFLPAYFLCSLVLWLRGKNSYRDNPFEKQAFGESV